MERIYGKPLLTQEEIRKRVKDLGRQITVDYEGKRSADDRGVEGRL